MNLLFSGFELAFVQHQLLGYAFLYLATLFFGSIAAFTSFWLAFRGVFGAAGIFIIIGLIFLAEVTSDIIWYTAGRLLSKTAFGAWVRKHLTILDRVEYFLKEKGQRAIILAKFLYGATYPVMFSAGWAHLEFKKFFKASLLATLGWLPAIFFLSYGLTSGLTYLGAASVFRRIERLFIIGIALLFVCEYIISRVARQYLRR